MRERQFIGPAIGGASFALVVGLSTNWWILAIGLAGLLFNVSLLWRWALGPRQLRSDPASPPHRGHRPPLTELGLSAQEEASLLMSTMVEIIESEPAFGRPRPKLSKQEQEIFRERTEVALSFLATALFSHWLTHFVDGYAEGKLSPPAAKTVDAIRERAIAGKRAHIAGLAIIDKPEGRLVFRDDVLYILDGERETP